MSVNNSEDSFEDYDSESSNEQLDSGEESGHEHSIDEGGFSQFRDAVLSEPTKFLRSFPLTPEAHVLHESLSSRTLKTRAAKLKSASGTPEYDAKFWLVLLRNVGEELSLTPKEMLRCVVALLQGEAYQWWTSVISLLESDYVTWKFFKRKLRVKYFGSAYCLKKHYEFVNLRQGSMTPQEYVSKFIRLSAYAPELVPTEALWCERFVYGLEYEVYSAVVGFKDTVFSTLRDRVLKIVEPCNRSKDLSDREKLHSKRPAESINNTGPSKKAKGTHQSLRSTYGFHQQSSALDVNPGSSTGRIVPFCKVCRRPHLGVCWREMGACFRCGSMNHIVRDCPQSSVNPSPSQFFVSAVGGSKDDSGSRDHKSYSDPQQQPSALVASPGGSASQHGVPFCDYCRHHHPGECWRKIGACLKNYGFPEERLQQVHDSEKNLEEPAEINGSLQPPVESVQDHLPTSVDEPVEEPQKHTYASILRLSKGQPVSSATSQPPLIWNMPPSSEWNHIPESTVNKVTVSSDTIERSGTDTVQDYSAVDEDEIRSVYVKNLSPSMTESELEEEFKKFGKISPKGVVIRSRKDIGVCYAFVEFEDMSGVHNAVEAGSAHIAGRPVYIEERRPNSYIPSRAGRGRGRGRGSYQTEASRGRSVSRRNGLNGVDRDYNSRSRGGNGYYKPSSRQYEG